jgi:hypothetical protein
VKASFTLHALGAVFSQPRHATGAATGILCAAKDGEHLFAASQRQNCAFRGISQYLLLYQRYFCIHGAKTSSALSLKLKGKQVIKYLQSL